MLAVMYTKIIEELVREQLQARAHRGKRLRRPEGAVGGRRKHDGALDGRPTEGALGDEQGAGVARGAVATGLRHRYPRLRHADDALTHGALLQRRDLRASMLAPRDALQPGGEHPEAWPVLRPLCPARLHDLRAARSASTGEHKAQAAPSRQSRPHARGAAKTALSQQERSKAGRRTW